MSKRNVLRSLPERGGARTSGAVWAAVGRRLQRKRTEAGLTVARVAQWARVSAQTYDSYENGAPIPAALLAQIADLFETPLVWFFDGVGCDESEESDTGQGVEPAVYRVATVEHRVQALADAFRQLDFEGQQHLLAISKALCRANASAGQS